MSPISVQHTSKEKKMKKIRHQKKKLVKDPAPTITEEHVVKEKNIRDLKQKIEECKNMIKEQTMFGKSDKVSVTKPADTDCSDMKSSVKDREEIHDLHHRRTLFVRFPYRVKDKEAVKKLHPGIEAVRFKSRIKSWCHVRFVSEEAARKALKKLHNMKLEQGGKLIVVETKKAKRSQIGSERGEGKEQKEKKMRLFKIFVKDLPESVTKKDIRSAFPKCAKIYILPQNMMKKCTSALVGFRNVDDMKAVIAERVHTVQDKKVLVEYSKSYLNLSDQEHQRAKKTTPSGTKNTSAKKQKTVVTPRSLGKMVESSLTQLKTQANVENEIEMDTSDYSADSDGNANQSETMDVVDVRSKTDGKLRTADPGMCYADINNKKQNNDEEEDDSEETGSDDEVLDDTLNDGGGNDNDGNDDDNNDDDDNDGGEDEDDEDEENDDDEKNDVSDDDSVGAQNSSHHARHSLMSSSQNINKQNKSSSDDTDDNEEDGNDSDVGSDSDANDDGDSEDDVEDGSEGSTNDINIDSSNDGDGSDDGNSVEDDMESNNGNTDANM